MQLIRTEAPIVADALQHVQNIIHSMALIHSRTYVTDGLKGISFKTFIHELVNELTRILT